MKQIIISVLLLTFSLPANTKTVDTSKLKGPLPSNIFVELAKTVNPSVVSISTSVHLRNRGVYGSPYGQHDIFDLFEEFFGPYGHRPRNPRMDPRRAPRQQPDEERKIPAGIGTGFIISEDGLVITNNHVIDKADEIDVQLLGDEKKTYKAEVIGRDELTDVAIIKIKAKGVNFQAATLGDSESTEVGEWVAAFGNPYGHAFSMSKGIISAKGRHLQGLNVLPFLQTDASINPGNSGGPLVNLKGEVIGVNTAIDARAQGIGFAIPINHVKSILPELKKFGMVKRGFLGVGIVSISDEAQQALKLKNKDGAVIVDIKKGSPADLAGLELYDVIVEFNKIKIGSDSDLVDAVRATPADRNVAIKVIRDGRTKTFKIKIGLRDSERLAKKQKPKRSPKKGGLDPMGNLGFQVTDADARTRRELNLPRSVSGAPVITFVDPNGEAFRNGLRVGDIVLEINKKRVKSTAEFLSEFKKGSNILRVQNGENISLVFLKLD